MRERPPRGPRLTSEALAEHLNALPEPKGGEAEDILSEYLGKKNKRDKADDDASGSSSNCSMVTALTMPMMQHLFGGEGGAAVSPKAYARPASLPQQSDAFSGAEPAIRLNLTAEALAVLLESSQGVRDEDEGSGSGNSMITALATPQVMQQRQAARMANQSGSGPVSSGGLASPSYRPPAAAAPPRPSGPGAEGAAVPTEASTGAGQGPTARLGGGRFTSAPAARPPQQVHLRRLGAAEGVTASVDYETMKKAIREMKHELRSGGKNGRSQDAALILATKLAPGARLNPERFLSAPSRPRSMPPAVPTPLKDAVHVFVGGVASSSTNASGIFKTTSAEYLSTSKLIDDSSSGSEADFPVRA